MTTKNQNNLNIQDELLIGLLQSSTALYVLAYATGLAVKIAWAAAKISNWSDTIIGIVIIIILISSALINMGAIQRKYLTPLTQEKLHVIKIVILILGYVAVFFLAFKAS